MAQESVSSPDGNIVFSVSSNDKHWLVYSVTFNDEIVIAESRLGLHFREQKGLDAGLEIQQADRRNSNETWEQPWGERRLVRDHHNEMLIHLQDDTQRRLDLRVRVFNDGLGFRYEIPKQTGLQQVDIVDARPATARTPRRRCRTTGPTLLRSRRRRRWSVRFRSRFVRRL